MHLVEDILKLNSHIKNGRRGEDITRTVTARAGRAGPRRHRGVQTAAPGVLRMDALAENRVDRRDAHIHAVNHSRVGGDPGVSMAPCDDESTDTIRLYHKGTHRCPSVMSSHCVSRPRLGLTQGVPVPERGRNKHSCSLLGYGNPDSQSRKGPATFS